ncbi:hypothetical protein M0805_008981 [Coniferiporia weirii]|nr:hypothetical protein M0805_008981 [Coniferiporia weirii]
MPAPSNRSQNIVTFDILGCGFGPANLGIAVALLDKCASERGKHNHRTIFVEKHPEFQWHPGMLLPGAQMQISFLKDLATLRDPTSPFTFLSYLHSQNRLSAFINRGSTIPSRLEFADYLSWAAREVERRGVSVAYAEEVVAISKVNVYGKELIEVTCRQIQTGALVQRRSKHIILSAGGSPSVPRVLSSFLLSQWPREVSTSAPVIHTSSYLTSIPPLLAQLGHASAPLKIAIVGGGQSSAECLLDMHHRLEALHTSGHQIDMIIRKGSLKPSDDSPFVNEIFDPSSTDDWYNLRSDHMRDSILSEYENTNYSVVSQPILNSLYELIYDQKISDTIAARDSFTGTGRGVRVVLRTYEDVIGAASSPPRASDAPQCITLTHQHILTHKLHEETYDVVICATGYVRTAWLHLLRASNLAEDFGLSCAAEDTTIKLVPSHYPIALDAEDATTGFGLKDDLDMARGVNRSSSSGSSSPSTRPSSPSLSLPPQTLPLSVRLRVSRAYRLLPVRSSENSKLSQNRIYLQGCVEATHGLSDSLLSVISVRSGEVVDDLLSEEI